MELKTALEQAFDEGSRSPYDLRDDIVQELLKKVPSTIPPMTSDNLSAIYWGLPSVINTILSSTLCYFSGGNLLRLFVDPTNKSKKWNGDWDIYCDESNFKELSCHPNLIKYKDDYGKTTSWETYRCTYKEKRLAGNSLQCTSYDINIIVGDFKNYFDVVKDFDIRLLQMTLWYENNNVCFFAHRKTWEDFNQNTLYLNPSGVKNLKKTSLRIRKYIARGFRDRTGLIECPAFINYCDDFDLGDDFDLTNGSFILQIKK